MSELKSFNCVDSDLQEFCEPRLVYLKSEADKVIAHHKYKRCLAMVEWCSYKSECFDQYSRHTDYLPNIEKYKRKRNHYADRCNKLLLLAEKFKEAK